MDADPLWGRFSTGKWLDPASCTRSGSKGPIATAGGGTGIDWMIWLVRLDQRKAAAVIIDLANPALGVPVRAPP